MIYDLLSAFPNLIANVSCFASSSAKSAGVFQTKAFSLEQCGCNFILGNTVKFINIQANHGSNNEIDHDYDDFFETS